MKFFLSGLTNFSKNLDLIIDAFIEADKLGFDGAFLPDHYMWGHMQFMHRRSAGGHPGGNVMHGRMSAGGHPGGNVMHGRMGAGGHPGGNVMHGRM
ncbi:MAG: hypothetical protein JSV20_07840, partial [Candidatus Bathyarchaeota archaeon]